jgi:hypothetical protein
MGSATANTEAQKHSPFLARLLKSRLAPIREAALLKAAMGSEKPVKPATGDCCGSSCNPCVMDLYRQELKVWKECAAYRTSLSDSGHTTMQDYGKAADKMPGSFDR